jgi:hypothetical protein
VAAMVRVAAKWNAISIMIHYTSWYGGSYEDLLQRFHTRIERD